MPLKLSDLKVSTKKAAQIAIGDDVLTLTFDSSKYTPLLEEQMQEFMTEGSERPGALTLAFLDEVLIGWDVVAEDGKTPLPPTHETLAGLPLETLNLILEGLTSANSPNPPSAEPSDATF